MAQQTIDVGSTPNDGTGDPIRDAFGKANGNFSELYAAWTALTAAVNARLVAASNLNDVASKSSARSNLGLAIGTDVQAFSARLATLSGVSPIADGPHTVGGSTITTSGGLITSIT